MTAASQVVERSRDSVLSFSGLNRLKINVQF